jgi:flagellar hook assembly protein FlgD
MPCKTIKLYVVLTVYNIMEQKIKTLINGIVSKGEHQAVWNGKNQTGGTVASGVYIYELKAANKRLLKKMIFAK